MVASKNEVSCRFTFGTWSGRTDPGRVKPVNEDALLMLPEFGIFCVADGMGGHEGGREASNLLVDTLQGQFQRDPSSEALGTRFPLYVMRICQAVRQANRWIQDFARSRGFPNAGATFVCLAFSEAHPEQALLFHAGDSRAYRLRGTDLLQLTVDHSAAEALGLDENSPELPIHLRNAVTRAVGSSPDLYLEKAMVEVHPGDLFLLCSDGLSRTLSHERLGELLLAAAPAGLDVQTASLIAEANRAGGPDNISAVLVRT